MNRRQHSQREAVDLQNAECVDVVLVPFDERAPGHGAVFDGNHFAQRSARNHKASDMLRQVAGKSDNLRDQAAEQSDRAIRWVKADLGKKLGR